MARARNIKPGIMANENLAEVSPIERLLFIYLWMLADREGRLEDRPKRIKAEALPYDDVDANEALNSLAKAGFIIRYRAEGQSIIQVVNFTKHQAPHMREQGSSLPEYVAETAEIEPCQVEVVTEHDLGSAKAMPSPSDSLIPDSLIPDSNTPLPPRGEVDGLFDQFWAMYPNKTCKAKARAKWEKLKVTPDLFNKIMAGLNRQCASQAWLKDGGQFVPHPTTWLNGERWNDEVRSNVHQLPSRHHGFADRDYAAGLIEREDGTYGF
ncbi:phage replication protein [Pseudomonas aeruginosa]|nr:phage replication protein [Pseudomonas aeruginosa]